LAGEIDAVVNIAEGDARGAGADGVAEDLVAGGVRQVDAVPVIARDDVAGAGLGTADGVAGSPVEDCDPGEVVPRGDGGGHGGTDVVPRDDFARGPGTGDLQAVHGTVRDQVAVRGRDAADGVARRVVDLDAFIDAAEQTSCL